MKRLQEIRARLAELKTEIGTFAEIETPTPEDEARSVELFTEWDTLTAEAAPLEERAAKVEEVRAAALTPANRTPGAPTIVRTDDKPENIYDLRSLGTGPDRGEEIRDRALRAIENVPSFVSDESRSHVESMIRGEGKVAAEIAHRILVTGSPAYQRAFSTILANPTNGMMLLDTEGQEAVRAALSLTDANGGYAVPFHLDPSIILTSNGTTNPFRQIARVVQVTGDEWHGLSSAGVTAEWLAEASEVTDASPTFAQPTVVVHKAAAWIQASMEVDMDTSLSNELGYLLADAKDNLEAAAFATGSGSGQPFGIVTSLDLTTASRVNSTTNGAYGVADVYALQNALPPRYRPNASWVAEQTTWNLTRQFATGSGPQHAFWADLGMSTPSLLLGKPVYESSAMKSGLSSATASNDGLIVLGDFRNYVIADRVGMSVVYEPLVKGANRRPTGEVGWFAFWRVGGKSVNDAAFRMLRV